MQPFVSYGRLGDAFKVFVLNAAGNSTSQSTAVFLRMGGQAGGAVAVVEACEWWHLW